MPWNEPDGDKDPWNGGNKKKKSSSGSNPADKVTELFSSVSDGGGGKLLLLLPLIAIALWVISGIYTIEAGQRGVVLHFGKFKEVTSPGLHWVAKPFSKVEVVDIDRNRSASDHTTMLTEDENIVDLKVVVQYLVTDPRAYVFNVQDADNERVPEQGVIYQVMRSAVREVVGAKEMDFIIKEGRADIEEGTRTLMQSILDDYKTGLQIKKINLTYAEAPDEVKDAFDDANRAREDFSRSKNKAETYANKVIPEARGQAARAIEEANAYKEQIVAKAEGDTSRFLNLAAEYSKAPAVTRERLYLDTMEEVMAGSKKIMMDTTSSNNMFYLPITSDATAASIPPPPALNAQKLEQIKQSAEDALSGRRGTRSGALREAR